jgi:hypothetical protein
MFSDSTSNHVVGFDGSLYTFNGLVRGNAQEGRVIATLIATMSSHLRNRLAA